VVGVQNIDSNSGKLDVTYQSLADREMEREIRDSRPQDAGTRARKQLGCSPLLARGSLRRDDSDWCLAEACADSQLSSCRAA
jgi:hypothetical protein